MNTQISRRISGAIAMGLCLIAVLSCGAPVDELEVDQVEQPFSSKFIGTTESAQAGVHLVKSWRGRKAKSVGAVRPWGETWSAAWDYESMCGATFISPHYAITAAHCVDEDMVPNAYSDSSPTKFRVEEYDITSLNMNEFHDQKRIYDSYVGNPGIGEWPAYYVYDKMTTAEGYKKTTNTCYLVSRCTYGRKNCDITTYNVDIALIYCPNRASASDNWVKVASSSESETSGNAEIWWFHEIAELAHGKYDHIYNPYMPDDSYDHYGKYGTSQNFHYVSPGGTKLQLLPVVSYKHGNSSNTKYKRVNFTTPSNYSNLPNSLRWVTARGCHGTSGSGVFVAGNWNDSDPRLLGPVAIHPAGWTQDANGNPAEDFGTGLCHYLGGTTNLSHARIGYVRRYYSGKFESKSYVQNDRP